MKKLNINMLVLAVSLAFSAGAMAEGMSKADYKAGKDKISAEYKTAKSSCGSLSGNASDICVAQAKGNEKVALADLEATYQPTKEHSHDARVARAEADYGVAIEKCDDLAGNTKDVCVKEAKAAETTGKANAKAQMKTSEANATASEKTADARKDANADKMDAQYTLAKEKCDAYSGNAKDSCIDKAKVSFKK